MANVNGIYNVWTHQKTTKNAWNLPLNESIQLMNTLEDTSSKEVYFTFHPTYTYYLTKTNKNLISFYSTLYYDSSKIKTSVQWIKFRKTKKRPINIPSNPDTYYKNKGWISWADFLGKE